MTLLHRLDEWSERTEAPWINVIRMILGLMLIIKGYLFLFQIPLLALILKVNFGIAITFLPYLIVFIHLFAGFLLIIGLATRLACAIQIPILVAAVIYNFMGENISTSELLSSVITLIFLVFFLFKGSGKLSVYFYVANSKRSRLKDEAETETKEPSLTASMDRDGNFN